MKSDKDSFGPIIDGFVLPDVINLPPELLNIIHSMSLAELKTILVVLAEEFSIGGGDALSLTEIQNRTGLSRASAEKGVQDSLKRGTLIRRTMKGARGQDSFYYSVRLALKKRQNKSSSEIEPPSTVVKLSSSIKDSESDTTTLTTNPIDQNLAAELQELGCYPRVAVSIIESNPPELIRKYIKAYKILSIQDKVENAGWLARAIKEHWKIDQILNNYHDDSKEDRSRYVGGEYAEFINH